MTTQDNKKPFSLPIGWPTDRRSKMISSSGMGWLLTHPDRESVVFRDGRWEPAQERGVA